MNHFKLLSICEMRAHPVPNGGAAYSIWFGYNDGDAEYFDAMETVELDLELITGVKGEVYAYRSNLPQCISIYFKRSGAWEFTEDPQEMSPACRKTVYRVKKVDCNPPQ